MVPETLFRRSCTSLNTQAYQTKNETCKGFRFHTSSVATGRSPHGKPRSCCQHNSFTIPFFRALDNFSFHTVRCGMNLWQIGCFYELPPKISYDSPSVLGFCLVGANCTGCKLNRSRPFGGLDYEATASGGAFRDVFSDSFIPRTDSCIFSLSINQGYPQQAEYTTVNITQTTDRTTTTT